MRGARTPHELCSVWAKKTFGKSVDDTFWDDKRIRLELGKQLESLSLTDKKVDGYAVQGLPRTQEGMGGGVSYTETFFEVLKTTGNCNLMDYLYKLVEKSLENGYDHDKISGILARSMRTFSSLMRDMDFAAVIENEIKSRNLSDEFNVTTGSEEDSRNHTDVLIKAKCNAYRIWLYQFSRLGLPNDIEKISGDRGQLPSGIHILCPLMSEQANESIIITERIARWKKWLENTKKRINDAKKGTRLFGVLQSRQERVLEKIDCLNVKSRQLDSKLKDEVLIWEGWYFYAEKKVKIVLETIQKIEDGKVSPQEYKEVQSVLNAPKIYLSKISSFKI